MKTTSKFGNRTWLQLKNLLTIQAGVLLLCLLAANGRAQTFTTLHSFTGGSDRVYSDWRLDFIGQHPVWDGGVGRRLRLWHGVRHQH